MVRGQEIVAKQRMLNNPDGTQPIIVPQKPPNIYII
jgi:hypothetical protein